MPSNMIPRTRLEVAQILENFLEGTGGERDWDVFTSYPIPDPELDAIRKTCAMLSYDYPPEVPGHYCGPAGFAVMRDLIARLRM